MNILFVSPSYKPAYIYGGPTVSVSELAEALVAAGNSVTVYTTTANGQQELDVKAGRPQEVNGVRVYYFKRQTGDHTHVSVGLWRKLWSTANQFDTIHLQSWWSLLIFGAAAILRFKGQRYIVSPRGMLSWYSFQNQHGVAKKFLHRLFGKALLRRSYLHATTPLEWEDCIKVHPSWRGFVLPNLVRFPQDVDSLPDVKNSDPTIIFGFLSRIDEKKGLDLLLEALAQVSFDFRLRIAGRGEEGYLSTLRDLASALGVDARIEWCGWKSGAEKFQFLRSIDVFVLTSHNENFANTVIESLVCGTPVVVSRGVGLANYIEERRLGWVCDITIASIVQNLENVYANRSRLAEISSTSPATIRQDFDKESLAIRYRNAYQSVA